MPRSDKPPRGARTDSAESAVAPRDAAPSPARPKPAAAGRPSASPQGDPPPGPSAVVEREAKTESSARPESAASPPPDRLPFVILFSDGACRGNPGPGGWAFILRHPGTGKELEGSGGNPQTTNNQMELMAVIEGLAMLKRRTEVEVVTDSKYVADGSSAWMPGWKRNGWRRKEKGGWKPVKNVELWKRLDELLSQHEVRFRWIRGHTGHPENERCDELAVAAAQSCGR